MTIFGKLFKKQNENSCPKCGEDMRNWKHCPSCGYGSDEIEEEMVVKSDELLENTKTPKKSKKVDTLSYGSQIGDMVFNSYVTSEEQLAKSSPFDIAYKTTHTNGLGLPLFKTSNEFHLMQSANKSPNIRITISFETGKILQPKELIKYSNIFFEKKLNNVDKIKAYLIQNLKDLEMADRKLLKEAKIINMKNPQLFHIHIIKREFNGFSLIIQIKFDSKEELENIEKEIRKLQEEFLPFMIENAENFIIGAKNMEITSKSII